MSVITQQPATQTTYITNYKDSMAPAILDEGKKAANIMAYKKWLEGGGTKASGLAAGEFDAEGLP